jgi:hypothetical protein
MKNRRKAELITNLERQDECKRDEDSSSYKPLLTVEDVGCYVKQWAERDGDNDEEE